MSNNFIMKNSLLHDSEAIRQAAECLDENECLSAIDSLNYTFDNNGKLIFCGVGKSGIVARKIAATFTSIGYPALFLNPTDALHGDLGIVKPIDTIIFISNSGETPEILVLIPIVMIQVGFMGN